MNGRVTSVSNNQIDWEALLEYATIHEARGTIYYQCKSFIPDSYRSRFEQLYAMELYSYQNRVSLLSSISAAFYDESIPFFTVKGLTVAALYPKPWLRTMGDSDIVVKPENKERAHEVFLGLGYKNHLKQGHEWTYIKNNLEFELHDHLLYDELGNTKTSRQFCDRSWDYVLGNNLDWNFHYIFLLLHLHKHLIHVGVEFRQFMDLYVLYHTIELNWEWINAELDKLGLLSFSSRCRDLTESWFGYREMTEEDELCLKKVCSNGIFGFHDKSNRENLKTTVFIDADRPLILARIGRIIGNIFPAYKNMRYVDHYSGLNGRPWLLPVFWFYRWMRAIRYGMLATGKRMIGDALVSNREIEDRKKELSLWGL